MQVNTLGALYRCPVCGSELSVIRESTGRFEPHCCNRPMDFTGRINPVYYCPLCGSELMPVILRSEKFEPLCCNRPMVLKEVQRA